MNFTIHKLKSCLASMPCSSQGCSATPTWAVCIRPQLYWDRTVTATACDKHITEAYKRCEELKKTHA